MDTNPLKYIFVSHASEDWNKVRLVRNYLEEQSFYPLLFHLKCLETGGKDFDLLKDILHREIHARRRFIYCKSQYAMKSKYVKWELSQVKTVKGAVFKEININKPMSEIQNELLYWTTFLKTIGYIGTWKSRIIQKMIFEKLKNMDSNIKIIGFEDDEHIPVWHGQLPQSAMDYIKLQYSKLNSASLVIAFKTSDYHKRGFCDRAEYSAKGGMRLLSLDIPDSQCSNPDATFIEELLGSIITSYFI